MTHLCNSTELSGRVSRSSARDVLVDYLADLLLPAFNELRAAYGIEPQPPRPGPPVTAEEAKAAAAEWWALEALRAEQAETEQAEWKALMEAPLVPVSDGISIYVNWQGPPVSDDVSCSSSGPVVRSVLTGRNESISAIARAEIGNPDYAVKFSPMPKGEARLEVTRATPAAATTQPILPQSPRRQHGPRKPTSSYLAALASKPGIARVEMKPDGTVVVVTGEPEQQRGNEVDEWIAKHARALERH